MKAARSSLTLAGVDCLSPLAWVAWLPRLAWVARLALVLATLTRVGTVSG